MKRRYFILFVIVGIAILIALYCFYENNNLTVTHYTVDANLHKSLRIVQLTDLHEKEFGKDNKRLIEAVKNEKPDIIVMTGDMQNKDDEDTSIVCSLIQHLSEITDVYYSYGNHEKSWEKNFNRSFADIVTEAGAIVIDNAYIDIVLNGNNIRIAGYMGYYRAVNMTADSEEEQQSELAFMNDFENTDSYKILLNHIPTSWVDWSYTDKYPVDLVLCGHYHGGQMQLPFIGPLYAPYVGFFPDNVQGIYQGQKAVCILSAGLGTEYFVPRINNPPEIVVIDLEGEK